MARTMIPPLPGSPHGDVDPRRTTAVPQTGVTLSFATLLLSAPVPPDVAAPSPSPVARLLAPPPPSAVGEAFDPAWSGPVPGDGAVAPPFAAPDITAVGDRPASPPAQQARRFGQDGFFGTVVTVGAATAVAAGTAIAAPAAVPCDDAVLPPPPVSIGPAAAASVRARPVPAAIAAQAAVPVARTIASDATALPAPLPPSTFRRTMVAAPPPPAPAAPRRPVPLPAAAFVAVAVQAVCHGLDVVARIDGGDATDRARLSDEIAALLSRHGHAPGRIVVRAPAHRSEDR